MGSIGLSQVLGCGCKKKNNFNYRDEREEVVIFHSTLDRLDSVYPYLSSLATQCDDNNLLPCTTSNGFHFFGLDSQLALPKPHTGHIPIVIAPLSAAPADHYSLTEAGDNGLTELPNWKSKSISQSTVPAIPPPAAAEFNSNGEIDVDEAGSTTSLPIPSPVWV